MKISRHITKIVPHAIKRVLRRRLWANLLQHIGNKRRGIVQPRGRQRDADRSVVLPSGGIRVRAARFELGPQVLEMSARQSVPYPDGDHHLAPQAATRLRKARAQAVPDYNALGIAIASNVPSDGSVFVVFGAADHNEPAVSLPFEVYKSHSHSPVRAGVLVRGAALFVRHCASIVSRRNDDGKARGRMRGLGHGGINRRPPREAVRRGEGAAPATARLAGDQDG
jgi:hypothetical protein